MHKRWTDEEDGILIQRHAELKSNWSLYVPYFHNRTENAIKQRWNTAVKKRHGHGGEDTLLRSGSKKNKDAKKKSSKKKGSKKSALGADDARKAATPGTSWTPREGELRQRE